jgi:PAS domain S-box-containing protein
MTGPEWMAAAALLLTSGGTIFAYVRKLWRAVKRVDTLIPLIDKLDRVVPFMETIVEQFKPNGGSSFFDKLTRIDTGMHLLGERVRLIMDQFEKGGWESDSHGNCTYINPSLCALMGVRKEDGLGRGWITAVHPKDRQEVSEEWFNAVRDGRDFLANYRYLHADGEVHEVQAHGVPVRDSQNVLMGYIGWVVEKK